MTNLEMYEKFKLEGIPVDEGMTQVQMREVRKIFLEDPTNEETLDIVYVSLYKDGKEFKVQKQDVSLCLASGMTEDK